MIRILLFMKHQDDVDDVHDLHSTGVGVYLGKPL